MDRLSVTTHLIAVLTAFSAFTIPIALEALNRIKERYGSTSYMDVIERIMGFTIRAFFGQLILALIVLIFFALTISSLDNHTIPTKYVLIIESLFSIIASVLLIKEFTFIKTVLLANRSDKMVLDHLIDTISTESGNDSDYNKEVELLVQIARFNIENTVTTYAYSVESRLFILIEDSYKNQNSSIDTETIRSLLNGLSVTLNSTRNTQRRDRYISLQRDYGRHLILFIDRKLGGASGTWANQLLYEEMERELHHREHWLVKADFLSFMDTWDIQNPSTLAFIDSHIQDSIELLVRKKPELVSELIENYRKFISYESHFQDELYTLSTLFGGYSTKHFDQVDNFTKIHKKLLESNPQGYINEFMLLLDKFAQDKLRASNLTASQKKELLKKASEYESSMIEEAIKQIGSIYAKKTTQHALRALAHKSLWHCILDCQESFNPAASRAFNLGVDIMPSSLSSIIQQFGLPYGYSLRNSDELHFAYIKATPLLVMYALYCWRIQNLEKNINTYIANIPKSLSLGERTIVNANKQLEAIKQAMYFAKSPAQGEAFCSHFGIEHETEAFRNAVIPILKQTQKYLNNQRQEIQKNQPLSDTIKAQFIKNCFTSQKDALADNPLLSSYSLTYYKPEGFPIDVGTYKRETFLDDTGVYTSFRPYRLLEKLHNSVAIKAIKENGKDVSELILSDLDKNDLLVIANKDWDSFTSSKNIDDIRGIKPQFIYTKEPLGKYYIHNTNSKESLVTLYHPVIGDSSVDLKKLYEKSFDFEFEDVDGKITVKANVYIDY
ncbi:hypothetical protein [Vibrio rotiferianus]|uniref:hypothetical protein n=1 Tax=Vibrio rotiferianus TaxID=190895 RepID=UPI00289440E3|nr:conserved hypothetical protein [Vibrio rotiferianus]CAH1575499.1 conserved hypothetical protein [Vibrio rotiferianus]